MLGNSGLRPGLAVAVGAELGELDREQDRRIGIGFRFVWRLVGRCAWGRAAWGRRWG